MSGFNHLTVEGMQKFYDTSYIVAGIPVLGAIPSVPLFVVSFAHAITAFALGLIFGTIALVLSVGQQFRILRKASDSLAESVWTAGAHIVVGGCAAAISIGNTFTLGYLCFPHFKAALIPSA